MTGESDLRDVIGQLEAALEGCEPLSQRARVVATALRLVEQIDKTVSPATTTPEHIAQIVGTRDLARIEQLWVMDQLRDETPHADVVRVLQHYQARLAQIEGQLMMALAYVATEREDEGNWWARTSASAIVQFLVDMAPLVAFLPAQKSEALATDTDGE